MPIFPVSYPLPSGGVIPARTSAGFGSAGPTPAGSTPPAPAGGYDPAYGGVPQVPSLIDIYGQATGANQRLLPQLTGIGTTITGNTEQELLNNLRMAIPGYDASVATSMGNIGALQRGQIPQDVVNLIAQQGGERGVATGLADSPNANAALLRALGTTSLGLEGLGEQQMSALVARTPQAQPFDISKLMLSPTDLYESQLLANIYGASPVPQAAANRLIGTQFAGYNLGKNNIPGVAIPPSLGPGTGYTPIPRDVSPPPWAPTSASDQWQYDDNLGAYYNTSTGEVSQTPGGATIPGFAWEGGPPQDVFDLNAPATTAGTTTGLSDDEIAQYLYGGGDTGEGG